MSVCKLIYRRLSVVRSLLAIGGFCSALLLLSSCGKHPPGIGNPVSFSDLPGWQKDKHAESWPALLRSCKPLQRRDTYWKDICQAAAALETPTDDKARAFFEQWFVPYTLYNKKGTNEGMITGYFEPEIEGSLTKTDEFKYPVYTRPEDMITVQLASVYPQLKGMRLRGIVKGTRLLPYYTREQINQKPDLIKATTIVWVKDRIALFFLQIQGSGLIRLPNKEIVRVGYADQNGHPYVSIGRVLVQKGEMEVKDASAPAIRKWLLDNPGRIDEILHANPSYIFFSKRDDGPYGSLGVVLTPERSIAVDRRHIPLGVPVWLATDLPETQQTYQRLMFAQDTGGAIAGEVRADLFWGQGDRAQHMAGHMRQKGVLFVLLPKAAPAPGKRK